VDECKPLVLGQKQLRYNLQKLMTRWQRVQLAGPFTGWLAHKLGEKQLRYNLQKLAQRRRKLQLSSPFQGKAVQVELMKPIRVSSQPVFNK